MQARRPGRTGVASSAKDEPSTGGLAVHVVGGRAVPPGDRVVEEARRRLYAPGATDEDRHRYQRMIEAAAQAGLDAERREAETAARQGAPHAAPPRGPSRARRLPLILLGATAVLLVGTPAVLTLPPSAPGEPVPAPRTLVMAPIHRAYFTENLDAGREAGIGAFLRRHQAETPLRGATELLPFEHWGTGSGSVALRLPADVPPIGRATVVVVTRADVQVGWTLTTLRPYLRANDPLNLLDRRAGDATAGVPLLASVPYGTATVPTTLHVDVPRGVHWGAAVVLTG